MPPNRSELVLAIFAPWHLGTAATPVNPSFTTSEADHQVTDAGAVLTPTTATGAGA